MEILSIVFAGILSLVMALAVFRLVRFFLKQHTTYEYKLVQDPQTGKAVETVVAKKPN